MLKEILEILIPHSADWAILDIKTLSGKIQRTFLIPESIPVTQMLQEDDGKTVPAKVLKSKTPYLAESNHENQLSELVDHVDHAENLEALHHLGVQSYLILPLLRRQICVGTLTLIYSKSNRKYESTHLEALQEKVRLIAVIVENYLLLGQMEQVIQTQDNLISIASHEMKTPLASIYLQIQILLKFIKGQTPFSKEPTPLLEERTISILEKCCKQTHRLSCLLDQLLDISQLRFGWSKLKLEQVDLVALVHEIVDQFLELQKLPSEMITVIAPHPVIGNWDSTRMEQVIRNLLSNALKYGKGKPIEISMSHHPKTHLARLVFKDQGIGIPDEHQTRIFEDFQRAAPDFSKEGLGIGLYIARQIILAQGGKISLNSTYGSGSIFTIEIPTCFVADAHEKVESFHHPLLVRPGILECANSPIQANPFFTFPKQSE